MARVYHFVLLSLYFFVGISCAFPHTSNGTSTQTPAADVNSTSGNRQGRAGFGALAQLVNPSNLAQFKSLFGGASALTSLLSFNMGNVVILSLLAGTALLIAPTLLSIFGLGSFSGLGRSLGFNMGKSGDHPTMTINIYKAVDDFFKNYNIDATSCMQRFACSTARKSSVAQRQGIPSYLDSMLNYVLTSNYVKSALGHTKFAQAINFGENGGSCEVEYGKCPFSWDKVTQYMPSAFNSESNSIPNPPPNKQHSN